MNAWRRFHARPWWVRGPVKVAFFLVVTGLVLYPKFWLIPTWIGRLSNMNSVLDPQNPHLAPLEAEVRAQVTQDADIPALRAAVEKIVLKDVPYAWDWDTKGVMDWLPTVEEVFEAGADDCDGRAVVAASLLRRMGIHANLVSDILHVWVETPQGELMRPTSAEHTLVSGPQGTQVTITPGLVKNLGRGISYGVGAFPFWRGAMILAALALVLAQPWSSVWRRVAGVLLLWIAFTTVRQSGMQASLAGDLTDELQTWVGWGVALAAVLTLAIKAGAAAPHSAPAPAE